MPTPAYPIFSLGGAADNVAESLPSPTLLVVVYALMWLGLVAWIAWLATRQHRLSSDARKLEAQLQAHLNHADRRSPDAS